NFVSQDLHRAPFFFFFQAEDGIRDRNVTGVQTCALPICLMRAHPDIDTIAVAPREDVDRGQTPVAFVILRAGAPADAEALTAWRSEERRVGKECRGRWAADDERGGEVRAVSERKARTVNW